MAVNYSYDKALLAIQDCDNRIAKTSTLLEEEKGKDKLYSLLMLTANLNEGARERLEIFLKPDPKVIQSGENCLKLVRVEKMVYVALTKVGNNDIFPRLLAKYDELMSESYQIGDDCVQEGLEEGTYLDYCSQSLKRRHYIKAICDYGMAR